MFQNKNNEPITDKYIRLMDEGKLLEALEVIKEIINLNPNISTSHFNHGICLYQLGHYDDSATAFLKAYELDDTNGGALYRACISLALANNKDRLFEVFKAELEWNPSMINNFIEEEAFNNIFLDYKFQMLKEQYSDYIDIEE